MDSQFALFAKLFEQCSDVVARLLTLRFVTARDILILSMTCRAMHKTIDSSLPLLADLLQQQYIFPNYMMRVCEYEWEINIEMDAYACFPCNNLFTGAMSGTTGEEFMFDVHVRSLAGKYQSAIPTQNYLLQRWRLTSVERRDGRATMQAHYKWTTVVMRCIDKDYALTKPTYLRVKNLIVHAKVVVSRSLLATRMHDKCMSCGFRSATWTSYACCIPRCRKLCQFCSSDRMVTERTLRQRWKVSSADITILRRFAYRYHASNNTTRLIRTWIPRACVMQHFDCHTWPEFLAQTCDRASCRPHAPHAAAASV